MAPVALPLMSANSYWSMAKEAVYGTVASVGPGNAASVWTPINSPKVTPGVKWLDDGDFRGSPVTIYDNVQGVFAAQFDGKTFTYTDTYPSLLVAALGSTDTTASVGVGLYTHTIGLNNSPNTGSQAPSYTIYNDSVDATYMMPASRLDTLSVSFAADAAVENTFTFKCNQPQTVASVSNVPESVQHLIPAWNCSASIGGALVSVVENFQLDIKRNTSQIYALGSQSAVSNFQGPIDVMGKLAVIVQQGETYWANALVRDLQAVSFTLVDPVTNYSILYQMTQCQLRNPIINQGKNYVSLDLDFVAIANQTDQVTFGFSPIKTVTTNGVIQAY